MKWKSSPERTRLVVSREEIYKVGMNRFSWNAKSLATGAVLNLKKYHLGICRSRVRLGLLL